MATDTGSDDGKVVSFAEAAAARKVPMPGPIHMVDRPIQKGEWVTSVKYQVVAASGHVIDEGDNLGNINQRAALLTNNATPGMLPLRVEKITTSVLIEDANQDGPRRA